MARPTSEECATAREQYADAIAARHRLVTGSAEVLLRMGEKTIQFAPADIARLDVYIAGLKQTVNACDGCRRGSRMLGVIPTN